MYICSNNYYAIKYSFYSSCSFHPIGCYTIIKTNSLYEWQTQAFTAWNDAGRQGIVQAPTGVGKTIFALYCMQVCKCSTIIIVPTIVLAKQWQEEIAKNLSMPKEEIGLYYSGKKDLKHITVAVINSVREKDLSEFELVICDETHRYGSYHNIKPLANNKFIFKLGITATLQREDDRHEELQEYLGKVVYNYEQKNAINDGILNGFSLYNISVTLNEQEQQEYNKHDEYIRENFKHFSYSMQEVINSLKISFTARNIMKSISARKMIAANAMMKVDKTIELVQKHKHDRVLVFNEYIETANAIYEKLKSLGFKAGLYHSKSKDTNSVNEFADGKINVLIAVRSLNEGLNVIGANVGIMVSSNKVQRNTIQRLGRILRKKQGKQAFFYQMYCSNTKEEQQNAKRTSLLKKFADKIINDEESWF